ncbi:MAG: AraC family transcriptional regulator, partial [Burkholderiales bacterium]
MADQPNILSQTPERRVDVLSDLLRVVRLSGASLFRAEFREPWCVQTAGAAHLARVMGLVSRCVVPFHVVMDGRCRIVLGDERADLEAGDVVIITHGESHTLGGGDALAPLPLRGILPPPPWTGLPDVSHGGSGPAMHLFCGFLHCDAVAFGPLLASLPQLLVVRAYREGASVWLRSTVELIVREVRQERPGARLMLERLNEVVFVESLREYMANNELSGSGWLAGVKDRHVGRALELMHADPARSWTVPELARAAGISRSVLTERFGRLVGQAPIEYLKVWRLHLASAMLHDGERKLREVAEAVGYESEAAFSKAFRRIFGAPPGSWRRGARAAPQS